MPTNNVLKATESTTLDPMVFKSLETTGFVVLRGFLSSDEVDLMVTAHANRYAAIRLEESSGADETTMPPSYITVLASFIKDRPKLVMDKVQTLVDLIAETTDISANYIPSMYPTFMDTNLVQFNWHQDTDTAFKYQDLYNSINVWIPIVKTNADQCGLHLLPFDVLKQLNSSLWERMVGTGASCVVPNGQNTHVWFQEDNQQMPLGFDITDYAVTPSVLPGDAIILRGDVCHASQVGESRRVALSFRCFNPRGVIYRDRFFAGSEVKKKFIAGNPIYNKVIRAFESAATVSCIEV